MIAKIEIIELEPVLFNKTEYNPEKVYDYPYKIKIIKAADSVINQLKELENETFHTTELLSQEIFDEISDEFPEPEEYIFTTPYQKIPKAAMQAIKKIICAAERAGKIDLSNEADLIPV